MIENNALQFFVTDRARRLKADISNAFFFRRFSRSMPFIFIAEIPSRTFESLRTPESTEKLFFRVARRANNDRAITRSFSSLSHVDADGKAKMVDVGDKSSTNRRAEARGFVFVGPSVVKLIAENNMKKGDVLVVAQLAGIIAAKKTADLIPLCHPLSLNCVNVELKLNRELETIEIKSEVRCYGKTGVEMEALTAVAVSALTIYDMCKAAAGPEVLKIGKIEIISKSGGRSGDFLRAE